MLRWPVVKKGLLVQNMKSKTHTGKYVQRDREYVNRMGLKLFLFLT
jgi:hypothetical protein